MFADGKATLGRRERERRTWQIAESRGSWELPRIGRTGVKPAPGVSGMSKSSSDDGDSIVEASSLS